MIGSAGAPAGCYLYATGISAGGAAYVVNAPGGTVTFPLDGMRAGQPVTRPAVPSLPAASPCFGRGAEISQLVDAVTGAELRPVPILGPPGIGKTTVTLAAAHDPLVADRYGTARFFIRCDGIETRDALVAEMAAAFGLPLPATSRDLVVHLAGSPSLIVLDNAETLVGDGEPVERLLSDLAGVPGTALVASMRGEQTLFDLPWCSPSRIRPLDLSPARQAFLDKAGPNFGADPDLDRLLTAVDCVPLAVTLLAHQSQGQPDLAGVWQRWERRTTEMLKRGDGRDRLTSMEWSIELSYTGQAMTEQARKLLQIVALLPAGLARQDVDVVSSASGADAMAALLHAGLAFIEADRVRLLAPIREFVRRRHPAAPPEASRVMGFYLGLAALDGAKVGKPTNWQAMDPLLAEAPNIEEALLTTLAGSDPRPALAVAPWVGFFVAATGALSARAIETAAEVACALGEWRTLADCTVALASIALCRSDHAGARQRYEQVLPLLRAAGNISGEADCVVGLGNIALQRSDLAEARRQYGHALQLRRQVGDEHGEASCIAYLGEVALQRCDPAEARTYYEQALVLFRGREGALREPGCIFGLARAAHIRSDDQEASRCMEQARLLYRQLGDVVGEAGCVLFLGDCAHERSDYGEAYRCYEQALAMHQTIGVVIGQADCLWRLAAVALKRSDHDDARSCLEQALPLYRQGGVVPGEANCCITLADIAWRCSDHARARRYFEQALSLCRQVGDTVGEAVCLRGLGDLAHSCSDHVEARRNYEEALPYLREAGDVLGEAFCLQSLGEVACERSDLTEARRCYEQALPRFRQAGSVLGEANCIVGLGDTAPESPDHTEARLCFEQAIELYLACGSRYSVALARVRLARIARDAAERRRHVREARNLCHAIDRPDLVAAIDEEFGVPTGITLS